MTRSPREHRPAPPLLAVGVLSAAVLAYEILLMRLFAIVHWHHFAFMMISIALLGYGASGTLLALTGEIGEHRLRRLFPAAAGGFSLASVLCFALAQQMPFNALEVFWDVRQWGYLAAIYGVLLIPFLLAATGVGAVLRFYKQWIPSVYAADLAGAGTGAGLAVGGLYFLPPPAALLSVAGFGAAAAVAAAWHWRMAGRRVAVLVVMSLFVLTGLAAARWGRIAINPYKPLAQVLRVPGTQRLFEGHHPMGWFSAVESRRVPFRHAPGLSLNSDAPIPDQVAFFVDGQGMNVVDRFVGRDRSMAYLQQSTISVGLHLRPRAERVFIADAGGGQGIRRARAFGAQSIDAVEAHPFYLRLLQGRLRDFSGFPHLEGPVHYRTTTVRAFFNMAEDEFDLIQLSLAGDGGTGASAFGEDTLLTVEGLGHMWRHLKKDGLIVMPLWTRLPPRNCLKAFNLAVSVLENQGVPRPAENLAVIRDWRTAVVLIGKTALRRGDRHAVRRFCRMWGFDLVYLPDLRPEEINRHSVLARPLFAEGARRLAGRERGDFVERYKYDLRPPTDDRPFFGQFFRWKSLPEIAALRQSGGIALLDWGYPVLLATLVQATVLSAVLIGLPVWWRRRRRSAVDAERWPGAVTLLYFGTIGGGFIFLEMAFIHRLTLFLHHPLMAAALVLAGFLLGAGAGSLGAHAVLSRGGSASKTLIFALSSVVALGLLQIGAMHWLTQRLMGEILALKVMLTLALILLPAVPMGMAFPLGINVLTVNHSRLIPWAWGINGCATVVGAVTVPLLAMHLGYAMVMRMALVLYAIGLIVISGCKLLNLHQAPGRPSLSDFKINNIINFLTSRN
ncbi:MAG: hypothetical protein QNI89_11410 [Desulfobacterales bacterium]|nr:hypothetical protein [Desulfobacterales bacterium]